MYYTRYCCNNNSNNVNYMYNSNSGGGLTMKKKIGSKFSKVSSNGQFSLNGDKNGNIFNYVGNPNSAIAYNGCNTCVDSGHGRISVKNYSGYHQTRISSNNEEIKCNINNSFQCYKDVNSELIGKRKNKHFIVNNSDSSSRTEILRRSACAVDRTAYEIKISECENNSKNDNLVHKSCHANNRALSTAGRINYLMRKNNITKDNNFVRGYTPSYYLYYNDSTLYKKVGPDCMHNYPNAKVIAC